MRLFSYVVARDYGFAPNPFFGVCTLATCKPEIRRIAQPGDWIIGTGSATAKRAGYLVYVMRIDEALTFNEYWNDKRFQRKKPNLRGSKKQAFGDNIYRKRAGLWRQLNSHHSCPDGSPNAANIANDTQADRVLLGSQFIYWGCQGPKIPARFDVCAGRGHRSRFPAELIGNFLAWTQRFGVHDYVGEPIDWKSTA
jgi:hypothetical protein